MRVPESAWVVVLKGGQAFDIHAAAYGEKKEQALTRINRINIAATRLITKYLGADALCGAPLYETVFARACDPVKGADVLYYGQKAKCPEEVWDLVNARAAGAPSP